MKRDEAILIKQEFDRAIRYLQGREEKLTVAECMQEIGALRMYIYNLPMEKGGSHEKRYR